jgi:hypothetical protein
MIIGTLFTLFVVPSIYLLLARTRSAKGAVENAAQDVVSHRISPEGAAA